MESPVVLDKPPEYGNANNERGFPFDEEDGSGAWSQLAARHPDIAARLRARPQTWQRKRRPSQHDTDDFGDEFSGFDRFPFDDIPPEFREHFPQHFTRREHPAAPQPPPPPPQQQTSSTQTSSTQTEQPSTSTLHPQANLPQYGLRNTVDLGQKSPVDPSVVDAEDRNQRSMSAPPESRNAANMSHQPPPPQPEQPHQPQPTESHSNVRHIPIFVEGRDEPVIHKPSEHGATHAHHAEPAYAPPPPHVDRDSYFTDDIPVGFNHPQNFTRAFGTPFHKGFRQGPQPFVQQKVYPQTGFARAKSPHRSQSPKPHPQEEFVKVPVHHENKPDPSRAAPKPTQQQQQQPPQPQAPPPQQQAPPPKPAPSPNDPITQILAVQTDVLNLMTEVENFTGSKKDKQYMLLDELLTRNLIKLDNIETEGKENIRQARKEAIKCIQKCIAVLEAKAEKGSQAQDVEMKENEVAAKVGNGEETKEETQEPEAPQPQVEGETKEEQTPQAADTRPEEPKEAPADGDSKASPKKKATKKRDKSKESQPAQKENSTEAMQVDAKGDSQTMELDGAAASQ